MNPLVTVRISPSHKAEVRTEAIAFVVFDRDGYLYESNGSYAYENDPYIPMRGAFRVELIGGRILMTMDNPLNIEDTREDRLAGRKVGKL